MRYYSSCIFGKSEKMSERLKESSSLIKLGKVTNFEARLFNVYCKGVNALKSRFYFYKSVISGDIKYNASMGTESTYKERATSALKECHLQVVKIKNKLSRLFLVEMPERYSKDFESLMYFTDQSKRAERRNDSFMKDFCNIIISQEHALKEIDNSIVSDCEMLGFCVCKFGNVPPYMSGCIRSGVDMLDEDEFMKKFKESVDRYAEWLGKNFGPKAKKQQPFVC